MGKNNKNSDSNGNQNKNQDMDNQRTMSKGANRKNGSGPK